MLKTICNSAFSFILLFFSCYQSLAQQFIISGFIEDHSTGEKLINTVIYSYNRKYSVLSNNYGFYSIKLPAGQNELFFSYVGFKIESRVFILSKDTTINIGLVPDAKIDEVLISASKPERNGRIEIIPSKVKELPAIMGEIDVLKTLQFYPGVQSGIEGRSGLYVRGGGPDQNLILLDGVPVYNSNHLFGFFSVFNPDAISSVNLYKSDVPARYGGFLSSVLDIQMKEGNNKEWKGDFTIGLIASKLTIEGPLKKDKSSVIFSARRSYVDILLWPIFKINSTQTDDNTTTSYYFQDFNLKLNYCLGEKDHLYLSMYTGTDKAHVDDNYKSGIGMANHNTNMLKWGNITTAIRWNHVFNHKLFVNNDISYSRYHYETDISSEMTIYTADSSSVKDISHYNNFSGIESFAQNTRFDYYSNPIHHLQFGFGNTYFIFTPGSVKYEHRVSPDTAQSKKVEYINPNVFAYKLNLYMNDEIHYNKLKLNIGAHYSVFNHKSIWYRNFEPRIGIEYSISEKFLVDLSFNQMAQYIHLASNNTGGLPTDLWLPVTENVKPATATQYTFGFAYKPNTTYRFGMDTYYKTMSQLLEYKEGISYYSTTQNWEQTITQGSGEAYGIELLIEKKAGRLTGFVGYTIAWSNRQFTELNKGMEYPYKYDRRHDVSVVGTYQFSERINLGVVWVYGTGNSVTLPVQRYASIEELNDRHSKIKDIMEYYGSKNGFKLPSYHRLDLSVNLTKQKKMGTRTWSFGIYNVYNRQNPYMIYVKEVKGETRFYQKSLFPLLPYFSYNYRF